MENAQVSSHYTLIQDPVSLEGLDDFLNGLLDKVFDDGDNETASPPSTVRAFRRPSDSEIVLAAGTDNAVENVLDDLFGPDDIIDFSPGIIAPSNRAIDDSRPSLFEADTDHLAEWKLKVRLLESQLDYRNEELKRSLERIRFVETQLAAKDDQLRLLPELLKRGIDATRYEMELTELKDQLECLSEDLSKAQNRLEDVRSTWIGRFSLWLTGK
ncbi:MAG: hypothetical protein AB7V06_12140 [Candidatus Obscuribacterales bacterium]